MAIPIATTTATSEWHRAHAWAKYNRSREVRVAHEAPTELESRPWRDWRGGDTGRGGEAIQVSGGIAAGVGVAPATPTRDRWIPQLVTSSLNRRTPAPRTTTHRPPMRGRATPISHDCNSQVIFGNGFRFDKKACFSTLLAIQIVSAQDVLLRRIELKIVLNWKCSATSRYGSLCVLR
jgi:hypothetical protein